MSKSRLVDIADYIYVRGISDAFSDITVFPNDPREDDITNYFHEIVEKLKASGLTELQKISLDGLEDVFGAGLASARDSGIVRGMQAYAAIQMLVENPEAVLAHIEDRCKGIREICPFPELTNKKGPRTPASDKVQPKN